LAKLFNGNVSQTGAASAMPTTARFDGRVQGVGDGHVLGWVWDKTCPDTRLSIQVFVDGDAVEGANADALRDDLLQAKIGDGAHGFLVALPDTLAGPTRHEVSVVADDGRYLVPISDSFWYEAKPGSPWVETIFVGGQMLPRVVARMPEHSGSVVITDGWWFDGTETTRSEPRQDDIALAVETLRTNTQTLTDAGISLVFACLPSKLTMLRQAVDDDGWPRPWVRALSDALCDVDGVEMIDLFGSLNAAQRHGALYHRTDAGLNARGAFFAARALLKEAAKRTPRVAPLPLTRLHLDEVTDYVGDLAVNESRADGAPPGEPTTERGVVADLRRLRAKRMPLNEHLALDPSIHARLYITDDLATASRVTLVAPRTCLTLLPWIAEAISRTTFFCAEELPLDQIELEKPDVVLHVVPDEALQGLSIRD
jgi:hypothetical protein